MSTRFRSLSGVALLVALLLVLALPQLAAAANTIVTPANPDGWAITDQRDDATVSITADNPRSGLGSLKFTTNTVTSGQDKVDFTKTWAVPGRTLAALSDVSYDFYRDASSTTATHFAPVLRLLFSNDNNTPGNAADDHVGYLIWEPTTTATALFRPTPGRPRICSPTTSGCATSPAPTTWPTANGRSRTSA